MTESDRKSTASTENSKNMILTGDDQSMYLIMAEYKNLSNSSIISGNKSSV